MPKRARSTKKTEPAGTLAFAIEAAQLLEDRHCEDILLLEVRGLSQVFDYILIGTGTSARQMKSIAVELDQLGREHSEAVFRSNRDEGSTWIVIDFVDIVIHLFEPDQRAYYDLEELWSDGEVIDWARSTADGRSGSDGRVKKAVGRRRPRRA